MKKTAFTVTLVVTILTAIQGYSQDFSNKGKDFWVAYGYHQVMNAGNSQEMVLYFATESITTVTVEIPRIGYSQTYTNIPANTIFTSNPLPKSGPQDARLYNEGVSDLGIHIMSDKPIVAYAHIYNFNVSGATLLFPTATLGREYYSINYNQVSNSNNANSWFYAIAVDTGITTVEIIPSASTLTQSPNVGYTVNLQQGQVINMMGTLGRQTIPFTGVDLTGSSIRSVASASGACKRIAVFSGSGRISISCNGSAPSSDNYMVQAFPKNAWGKNYLTVPTGSMPNNFYRVCVTDPATVVKVNGTTLSGIYSNFFYEFSLNAPAKIEADQPILVAQYITSQGECGNGFTGDPEVIYLSPIEQSIDRVILNSTGNYAISQHWVNVVIKASVVSSFLLDGFPSPVAFQTHPQDPQYMYAMIGGPGVLNQGQHTLTADSGFSAIAYGFGEYESYGYNAGTNVKDLYQFISIQNQYASVNFPASCRNTPFYFSMTFPYQPTQIRWDFFGLFPPVTINSPAYDSTWIINGRQLYRYKLSSPYSIATAGSYPVRVYAINPTADGCSGEQQIDYELQVFESPDADFSFSVNGCASDTVYFTDASNTEGRPVSKWFWDFGDSNIDSTKDTKHKYLAAGTYTVKHALVTDIGCLSDTATATVVLADPPLAQFAVSTPTCVGMPVSFTDQSSPNGASTLVRWVWNFGDGSPPVTATTNAPQSHLFSTAGTYNVTLEVETSSGCRSFVYSSPVTINPKPLASFGFGNACLPNASIQFTDQSTIADGSQGQFNYQWNFGDGNTSAQQNPANIYTTAGPFNATLTVTSNNGCVDDTMQVINTVYSKPVAAFNTNTLEPCLGVTVSFTDASTAAGSSVTQWYWDFGDGSTSTFQNPTKQYATAGTYRVKLVVTSAVSCQSDTTLRDITVLPLPTTGFNTSSPVCETQSVQFISSSVANAGVITQYTWSVNGTPTGGNNATINYTPSIAGAYTVQLSVQTDKGCTGQASSTINVNAKPVASFVTPVICLPAGTAPFNNLSGISDGSQLNYQWNFGDGNTSTQQNPVHTYVGTGPFNVMLTTTSANGCADDTTILLNTIYAQPQAAFTATPEVCIGAPVNFTDQSTAPNSTVSQWLWNFGDGTTSTQQNPAKTYAAAGTYNVTLTVTSAAGCPSTISLGTVIVNALPTADFNISNPECVNQSISFTDASVPNSGNLVKWTWNYGEGGNVVSSNGNTVTHIYSATGTYNASLVVESDKGCVSTLITKPVVVNPVPVAAFAMPESCVNDPFSQFSDQSTISDGSAGQLTYLWNFADPNATAANPNTSTARNPQHKYIAPGIYNVTLTVTSNNGCATSITQPFTVNGGAPQSIFNLQGATIICSDNDVTITNNSTVDFGNVVKLEVYWDYTNDPTNRVLDDDPQPGESYTFHYPAFGTPASRNVSITVVAYSGDNCLSTSTQVITLQARPELQFSPIAGVCEDVASFQLPQAGEVNGLPGSGIFTGPGVSSTGVFDPGAAGAGNHTVRYSYTSTGGCTNYIEQVIPVFPLPVANAGPDRVMLEGGVITINGAGSTGYGLTYLWTPATALDNTSSATPRANPITDITYSLLVTTAEGCTDTDEVFVKILLKPIIPNVFSPNGDGINDTWEITSLESYPGATVEIFNRYGQPVFRSTGYSRPWDGKVNGKDVPAGTYYYVVDPKNGRQKMAGFVDVVR